MSGFKRRRIVNSERAVKGRVVLASEGRRRFPYVVLSMTSASSRNPRSERDGVLELMDKVAGIVKGLPPVQRAWFIEQLEAVCCERPSVSRRSPPGSAA